MTAFEAIAPQPGTCDVCGESRMLNVLDRTANLRVGDCCYGALVAVHHALNGSFLLHCCGLRHPAPNEFREQDNH
jgi:hypothetical protein